MAYKHVLHGTCSQTNQEVLKILKSGPQGGHDVETWLMQIKWFKRVNDRSKERSWNIFREHYAIHEKDSGKYQ